jgi:hypothetical protein
MNCKTRFSTAVGTLKTGTDGESEIVRSRLSPALCRAAFCDFCSRDPYVGVFVWKFAASRESPLSPLALRHIISCMPSSPAS